MHGSRAALVTVVLVGQACSQSHGRDPAGAGAPGSIAAGTTGSMTSGPSAGDPVAQPDDDSPAEFSLTGRWTSSLFEDPLEAELVVAADGTISGRICAPGMNASGDNCGNLTAAWIGNGMIHFDFELPWPEGADSTSSFQFVGARGNSPDVFQGGLLINGQLVPVTFARCPARGWCAPSEGRG